MNIDRICMGCMRALVEGESQCRYCGYRNGDATGEQNIHHLKPYTILAGKYLVGKVLGEGGFGITYIGMDLNLEMKVAIKEFYPNGYVTREGSVTSMVTEYAGTGQQAVMKWKEGFIREARILAKCSNLSGIVGVNDFFTENNTAYIIMEYVEGETLKEHLGRVGGKMPVQEVISLMRPVITSLSKMHELGLIHRDISPDNIIMQPGGSVKLLDLGAARDYASEGEKSLSVMLKPGYAPEEQYRTKGKQGPWSDVYALCATIYKCITGITPPESMERMREDDLQKPGALGITISKNVEECILKGMEVYSEKRIQNMDELQRRLYDTNDETEQQHKLKNPVEKTTQSDKEQGEEKSNLNKWKGKGGAVFLIAVVAVAAIVIFGNVFKTQTNEAQMSETANGDTVQQGEAEEEQTISSEDEVDGSVSEETISSYEIIIQDCTWYGAYQDCISREGHLLRIESEEEYEKIVEMIENADLRGYVFWLGGKKDPRDGSSYRWIRDDATFYGEILNSGDSMKYWLDGEPSYYDDAGNEENCMDMFYMQKEGRWVWNDAPNDILAIASFYSGRIAYICEYEE